MGRLKCARILGASSLLALFCLIQVATLARSTHLHDKPPPQPLPQGDYQSDRKTFSHHRAHRAIGHNGQHHIPGLYDDHAGVITPIQGQEHFNQLVLGLSGAHSNNHSGADYSPDDIRAAGQNQTISLVQYYMATCPDCQGFSPYFKRFARDIQPHWRRLVRLYTVNCNDFQNIHLCQEQNPKLIVPMVRWYQLPVIQRDFRLRHCNFGCKAGTTLSIAHRQFIDEQRRDLISLRRATLRFVALMLNQLTSGDHHQDGQNGTAPTATRSSAYKRLLLFESLPIHWHQLDHHHHHHQMGRKQSQDGGGDDDFKRQFLSEITKRNDRCRSEVGQDEKKKIENLLIIESTRSFIGRTIIADWSNHTCASNQSTSTALIHRTSDFDLLRLFKVTGLPDWHKSREVLLFQLDLHSKEPTLKFLASNETELASRLKRHARDQPNRLERIYQRASLERFFSHLGASVDKRPIRYAAAMTAANGGRKHSLRKRETRMRTPTPTPTTTTTSTTTSTTTTMTTTTTTTMTTQKPPVSNEGRNNQTLTFENANWTPEIAYPGEERLRFNMNRLIAAKLNLTTDSDDSWPGALLKGTHPDEIKRRPVENNETRVDPVQDDLTLMFLTDYYKGLNEIVHTDMLAKAQVDGLQLLASCNFLRDLKRHFPYQGNALGSSRIGLKSIARYYMELLQNAWMAELNDRLREDTNQTRFIDLNLVDDGTSLVAGKYLEKVHVSSRRLEQIQLNLKRDFDLGLPADKHFKWNYCAGSSAYLRGHTCSLWILFHTLTTHEYLQTGLERARRNETTAAPVEYQFQIDFSKPPKRACNPANPDNAYLSARTQELYVNSTNYVLANVINFVRFYLPCTNCAAHFSCMVEHSPGLHFESVGENDDGGAPQSARNNSDLHLLWLWEGHNRVNERTRATHSEDPMRPKHIFPQFGACPKCYLEQPSGNATFASMRFNRVELVKFIVARYRKSAILNNKINIEELYKKT